MRCLWCKKDSGRNKYCCPKCNLKDYYQKHKDFRINKAKEWNKENPEKRKISSKQSFNKFKSNNPDKIREHAKKQYNKDKKSANCRSQTGNIIKKGIIQLDKICKKCGRKTNIEIHHEEYPTNKKTIIKAITDGKIYYLCKKCHSNHHSEKRKVLKRE